MTPHTVWRLRGPVIGVLLLAVASLARAQQRGTISGVVRDSATAQPIPQVQVRIAGSTFGALTNAQGQYRLADVPAGTIRLQARIISYRPAAQTVTVPAGGEVQADFTLVESALSLDELVVTASGTEESARQQATAPTQIEIPPVAPLTNMADALDARAAGVEVLESSGTTGAGTRIRIRGAGSISLSDDPIVYIDGVRVDASVSSSTVGVGGQVPSRIDDIDPDEIQSVQVIKGPAAAALYGTDAANGIILITTRRGEPGPAKWQAYVEAGSLTEPTRWPDNVFGVDTTKTNGLRYACTLVNMSLGRCTQNAPLFHLNPLTQDSPFRRGAHDQYGLSVSGGAERMTYYLAGDITNENGVFVNNGLDRVNLRANLTAALSPQVDVGVQTGYVTSQLKLPDNDNDALGYLGSGLLGNADTTRHGWGFLLPSQVAAINSRQTIDRFTSSGNVDARPTSWLTLHGIAGLDYSTRFDTRTIEPNTVPFNSQTLAGSRAANPAQTWNWNAKASAVARFNLSSALSSQTTVGVDFFHSRVETILASGQQLAAGTSSLAGIGVPTVNESFVESRTLGTYGEEQLGWRDKVYLTGSLRRDDNSAFGRNFNSVTYPKVGATWTISDEPFFPKGAVLSSLRLRSAYGVLGLAPGATDALQYYTPVPVVDQAGNQVAFTAGNLGNANLKPERDYETEGGLDAGLFRDRINATFTYYSKISKDALVSRILPPSGGVATSQFYNLGRVSNKGFELDFNGRIINLSAVALDVDVSAWANANKLLDLGGVPPIVFSPQEHQVGYPLGGYWVRPIISYQDKNGDGIIANLPGNPAKGIAPDTEVVLDNVYRFVGSAIPTHGWGFTPTLTLFKHFDISANFDHRGGNYLYNLTESFRCQLNNCPEINNRNTPFLRQAQVYSDVFMGQPNGFIEPADFTKLRELSITYRAPASWAHLMNAGALSITVAGRNLHTWTKYSGFDPEVSSVGQSTFTQWDFLTLPPTRYWSARVNLTF